jgi:hypothetical protein
MTHRRSIVLTGPLTGLLAACAADIAPDPEGPGQLALGDGEEALDDGSIRVTIDATSETDWVGYAFGEGVLGTAVPGDLDVQRYRLRLGDGVAAQVVDASWDDLTQAPASGYATDTEPLEDDESYVFNDWYTYDYATHSLAPNDVVFVVDDGMGLQVKVQVESYYDPAGTPGFLTFRWAELETAQ